MNNSVKLTTPFECFALCKTLLRKPVVVIAVAMVGCLPAVADYSATVLSDSPLGYWRLDADPPVLTGSPSTATNLGSLGGIADGTYSGSAGSVVSVPGALLGDSDVGAGFNGTDGQITVPNEAALNPRIGYSIEVWANMTNFTGAAQSPLSEWLDSANTGARGYSFYVAPVAGGARWEFRVGRAAGSGQYYVAPASGLVPTNEWCHLVGTYDGSNMLLYVNGALVGSTANAKESDANLVTPLRIGAGGANGGTPTDPFTGYVDEAAFYGTVLSPESILAHYEAGTGTAPVAVAPTFAVQPAGVTLETGGTLTLSAVVHGSLPMQYQWLTNGEPIVDATNLTLTIPNATTAQSGDYLLAASNAGGDVTNTTPATVTVNAEAAPSFTIDLPSQATVYAGGTAVLQVEVAGSVPTYQWTSNGVPIAGATGPTLTLSNAKTAWNGTLYKVNVTNVVSGMSSATCTLNVQTPAASSYAAAVIASAPVAYWRFGDAADAGVAQDYWGGLNGIYNNATHPVSPGVLPVDDDGAVGLSGANTSNVLVPHNDALDFSGTNNFTFAAFVRFNDVSGKQRIFSTRSASVPGLGWNGGYGIYVDGGARLGLTAFAVGEPFVTIAPALSAGAWHHLVVARDGTNVSFYVDGALLGTKSPYNNVYYSGAPLQLGGNPSLPGEDLNGDIDEAAVWNRALSSAEINGLYYAQFSSPIAPTVAVAPTYTNVYSGYSIVLSGTVAGTPPVTKQWYRDGTLLSGKTDSTLVVSNATSTDTGTYELRAHNAAGNGSASGFAGVYDQAPSFNPGDLFAPFNNVFSPVSTNTYTGYTISLTGRADGSQPITYQWLSNSVPIAGATNASLTFNNATEAVSGDYTLVASNFVGSVQAQATLSVQASAPFFVTQPVSKSVFYGGTVVLAAFADGSQPLGYQWLSNGVPVTGATNAILTVTNVVATSSYTVAASNAVGVVTNDTPAIVSVSSVNVYSDAVLADNPVAYWRMDESIGTTLHDVVGGHDAESRGVGSTGFNLQGALLGDADTCLGFTNAAYDVPYSSELNTPAFTAEMWVRVSSVVAAWRCPYASRDDTPSGTLGFFFYATHSAVNNSDWEFWLGTGAPGWGRLYGPEVATTTNQWTHLAGVYDGTNAYFYVNGELADHLDSAAFAPNTSQPLRLAAGKNETDPTYYFNGEMDEVAYYNKALSPERIRAHYLAATSVVLQISQSAPNEITLGWATGTLLEADDVDGPWTPVAGASAPTYTTTPGGARKFYRVMQ